MLIRSIQVLKSIKKQFKNIDNKYCHEIKLTIQGATHTKHIIKRTL